MKLKMKLVAVFSLALWSVAVSANVPSMQDSETKDTNSPVGEVQVQLKKVIPSAVREEISELPAGGIKTEKLHEKVPVAEPDSEENRIVKGKGIEVPVIAAAEAEEGEEDDPAEAIKNGLETLSTIRTVTLPAKQLIVLGIKALRNTLEEAGGFYGLIRDNVLADIQNQINLQKELEMKIKLDGYKAQVLHLQTLLGISDTWTMEDINNALGKEANPVLQSEMDNAVLTPLFMTDLNLLFHAINNDKNVFVLRSPGDIVTALTHYSEYATTQLYVTQAMIDLSINLLDVGATESYRQQFSTNAGYSYRYLQFSLGKSLDSLDAARGKYDKQYLRRSAYYRNTKIEMSELLSVQLMLDTSTGVEGSVDDSSFIRHEDVLAFKRNFDTSSHNLWLGCYNGDKNCGSSSCCGQDDPFENLALLPCMGEVFRIYGEKDGLIINGDVVAINYNDGALKGNTWYWLAVAKYSPDTRSCPGATFAQGQPFDPTCEYERLRIWSPERLDGEPLQDRDIIFIERQTDGKYLDISSDASMYRVYRHGSVFKGVAYWTE